MKTPITILATVLLLSLAAHGQTRAAVAVTVTSNANLGDSQAAIGGLGTVESRKDRFGFAATGTFGQIQKRSGGKGWSQSFSGQLRFYIREGLFIIGSPYVDHYSVRQFSKANAGVSAGIGIQRPLFTLTGTYGRDMSGQTRRGILRCRAQIYAPKKALIGKPYFEASLGVVEFTQRSRQAGAAIRFAGGFWWGK